MDLAKQQLAAAALPQRQQGISIINFMFLMGFLGFLATVGFKIFPLYYEGFQTDQILDYVVDDPNSAGMTPQQLKQSILTRMNINQVYGVKGKFITVKRYDGKLQIKLEYEKRSNILGELDAVMSYNKTREITPNR